MRMVASTVIATCAEPMKHLVPDEANSPPDHPA
jgi:hypothetical protein